MGCKEIKFKRCYKYKGNRVYVHARAHSEKTGKPLIVWCDIDEEDADWKITPEEDFEKEAELIEKKK